MVKLCLNTLFAVALVAASVPAAAAVRTVVLEHWTNFR